MAANRKSRMTTQRRVILEELRKMPTHPTADELYQAVRKRLPRISLGTVYRNLDVLAESGEIARLDKCGSQFRFDGDTVRHYHIRCTECGRIDDVDGIAVNVPEHLVRERVGYDVRGHTLEFVGVCPDCSSRPVDRGRHRAQAEG
jgi:Fur family ferric uptake transcriptional regulator